MSRHHLLVPPTGLYQMLHDENDTFDVDAAVMAYQRGALIHMTLSPEEKPVRITFAAVGEDNSRAREIVAWLGGPYMMFTGVVAISDLAEDICYEILRQFK